MKNCKIAAALTASIYAALRKAVHDDVDVVAMGDPESIAKDIISVRRGPVGLRIAIERGFVQYSDGSTVVAPYNKPGMVHAYAFFTRMPGTQIATIHRCKGELDIDYTSDEGSIDVAQFLDMFENAVKLFDDIAKKMDTPVC